MVFGVSDMILLFKVLLFKWNCCLMFAAQGMHSVLFKPIGDDVMHARDSANIEHLTCFLPGGCLLNDACYSCCAYAFLLHTCCVGIDYLLISCLWTGVLALGSHVCKRGQHCSENSARDLQSAKKLMKGCSDMYTTSPTGLAADTFTVHGGSQIRSRDHSYKLRPETVESLWVLFRVTGDEKYRDLSIGIFDSIYKYCRVVKDGFEAYGAFPNVNNVGSQPEDKMESFFLAETLK